MIIDARQMKKILVANGYEYKRCKGSHFMYSNGTNTVAVNNHLNKMVAQSLNIWMQKREERHWRMLA